MPERGDGQKYNPPERIAWSPDGEYIGVSCDAFGHSVYEVSSGRQLNDGSTKAAYGASKFAFWSHDGNFFASSAETSQNNYWTISYGPY